MKSSRLYFLLLLLLMFVLPSCGGGGGGSDTSGVLTMNSPTVSGGSKIGDFASVSFNVTYTPPTGKDPNGTMIHTEIFDGSGTLVASYDTQLYANTSYTDGFTVKATAAAQLYSVHISIGTMTSGSTVVIPAGT